MKAANGAVIVWTPVNNLPVSRFGLLRERYFCIEVKFWWHFRELVTWLRGERERGREG